MRFLIEVGTKLRTVTVERRGDVFRVAVDGQMHLVDVRRIDGDSLSLLLQKQDDAPLVRSIDASLVPGPAAGAFDVHVSGHRLSVQFRNGQPGRPARDRAVADATGPQRVTAPMPGKVVRVLVKSGDEVEERQGLAVVEAMKMENELRATRHGHIRDVAVSEGQSVEAGQVLLIVE
jgi:biotin carboxyl carrier protein